MIHTVYKIYYIEIVGEKHNFINLVFFHSTSISMKTETKKDNKKMSTFAVAKIGMKLKEKAKKKSLSSSASTKDPITTIEGGAFNETKNEISTAASGTTEAITVNSSTSSPTIIPSVSQSTKTLSGANQPGS